MIPARILVRNTLGRRLEVFEPWNPPIVNMYVCGPTPYDHTHIGHARTFVAFDGIKRYLQLRGFHVFHIQNITDIDDKIINRSKELGISWRDVSSRYAKEYLELLEELNVHIDIHPRVTDHINDIIRFIEKLIEKGYAYVSKSGSVYFNVDTYPGYGGLSGRFSREQWRQEEDVLEEKKNPYDFALWKAAKPGEPYWESPWGPGRPGWHIECSVMSMKYSGGLLDIHGGAADLIFPHHENERAQSEAYLGASPWVKYWLHTGYLTINNEKMSKSLGNIILLRDAIKKWGARTLRAWLLSGHYRAQIEYSEQSLRQASRLTERFRNMIQGLAKRISKDRWTHYLRDKELETLKTLEKIYYNWHKELSHDFNFSGAIREVQKLTNIYYSTLESSESGTLLSYAMRIAAEFNSVLAIADDLIYAGTGEEIAEKLIDLLVEVRGELRKRKLYEIADRIRNDLAQIGIILLDYKDRTEWRRE